jgi:hypothetical protein
MTWREDTDLTFDLTKGEHKFIVWSREGNARLDAVYMSTDPNADPKFPEDVEQLPEAVVSTDKIAITWGGIKAQ